MDDGKKIDQTVLLDEQVFNPELEEGSSKRSFQIRRALEDRRENRRLSLILGEAYWGDV